MRREKGFSPVDGAPILEVSVHFCFRCGCIGPCECRLEIAVEQMERAARRDAALRKGAKKNA